ncbi:sigma 54-interacting transcriptional regulator [Pseudomonas typographi]|uniref:sigma 54-interacting transcriptional regulator n=1 Tax=Pseudomonas typographi TaxID=2715964 RepID=UPI001686C000|nr:sigma 54-interacting transcriptional regulator [Pseudomonas typographi]MBD1588077.1 sigma 54-interacting transcriptional regulator [Pseudomonas typographi]
MFTDIPQPLRYAESLLRCYTGLAASANVEHLLAGLARMAAELANCDLGQVYLLDNTHTALHLRAEWQSAPVPAREAASLSAHYSGEQLLQYCLCQNQPLAIDELNSTLYSTACLPDTSRAWRSLLCLPLHNAQGQTQGLLLVATHAARALQSFAGSFSQLGTFALGHFTLLQCLRAPAVPNDAAEQTGRCSPDYGLLGQSQAMRKVYQLIGKVLHSAVSVLITGETGTGKELVARAIHDYGPKRSKPFIVQNCAALPESLLESELFGYSKGAFTGAERNKPGLFDIANGGTLLLDEIGDMPLLLQAKLLRALQEGEVRPLGSSQTHKVDVRIIAATHRNLRQQMEDGHFRADLFYRLSHFPIELPALRERGDDLPLLARHFAATTVGLLQRDGCQWSDTALKHLAGYTFPGNVRELKGLVERAVLLCEGAELLPEHFNLEQSHGPGALPASLRERMERLERNVLLDCLRKHHGNRTHTAHELGLARRTLIYRMQRLKICPGES